MKLRIFSDVHEDLGFSLFPRFEIPADLTLIAGDVSNTPRSGIRWILRNIGENGGMFVAGNHLCYHATAPIENVKSSLAKYFPKESGITFLDQEFGCPSKLLPDGKTLVIGDTMYTNFRLPTKSNKVGSVHLNMKLSRLIMGDFCMMSSNMFSNTTFQNCNGSSPVGKFSNEYIFRISPEYYIEKFKFSIFKISHELRKALKKHLNVILMTHFPISSLAIAPQWRDNDFNAFFVSDILPFLKKFPNIKAVISGHVHERICRYLWKNGPIMILNAIGYRNGEDDPKNQFDERKARVLKRSGNLTQDSFYTFDCILDTKTWKIDCPFFKMCSESSDGMLEKECFI